MHSGKGGIEELQHGHDVLVCAFRPDGRQLASATLDGQIYLWDPLEGELQVIAPACSRGSLQAIVHVVCKHVRACARVHACVNERALGGEEGAGK